MQGKLQQSKLLCLRWCPTDGVACRHFVVGRGESECTAQAAYQVVMMCPVAKKCSLDPRIRIESTESITDWTNRVGEIGFLPILNTEALENTEILRYSRTTSLTNSCLQVIGHFFPNRTQKNIDIYPEVTKSSFKYSS